ncbi:MAG: hypothetical protein ACOC1O_00155 [bacterium]
MKKFLAIIMVMMIMFTGVVFAQEEGAYTFDVRIIADVDQAYRSMMFQEIATYIDNEAMFDFVLVNSTDEQADFYAVVEGMYLDVGNGAFAWGVTIVPTFSPMDVNTAVATSNANVQGLRWLASQVGRLIDETAVMVSF